MHPRFHAMPSPSKMLQVALLLLGCLLCGRTWASDPEKTFTIAGTGKGVACGASGDDRAVVRFVLRRDGGFAPKAVEAMKATVTVLDNPIAPEDILLFPAGEASEEVRDDASSALQAATSGSAAVHHRVIVLLDRSGSMAEPDHTMGRWTQAMGAVNEVISGLPDESAEVAIAPFDCRFTLQGEFSFKSAAEWKSSSFKADLSDGQLHSCTTLYNAMAEAFLQAQGDPDHRYHVVVISDGLNDLRDRGWVARDEVTMAPYGELKTVPGAAHRAIRPWCKGDVEGLNERAPTNSAWGWIARPGDEVSANDGQTDCSLGVADDASLQDPASSSYGAFSQTLRQATQAPPGSQPTLSMLCFGFQTDQAVHDALADLCTLTSTADDKEALRDVIQEEFYRGIATLGVSFRITREQWEQAKGKPVVQIAVDGFTGEAGTLDAQVYDRFLSPTPEELQFFGSGPLPPLAIVLITFLVGAGLLVLLWVAIPRFAWREL